MISGIVTKTQTILGKNHSLNRKCFPCINQTPITMQLSGIGQIVKKLRNLKTIFTQKISTIGCDISGGSRV